MNKQIEEMAKVTVDENNKEMLNALSMVFASSAEVLYNAGYRKQSEVAREIFAELKKVMIDEYRYPIIAELKKKYEVKEQHEESTDE